MSLESKLRLGVLVSGRGSNLQSLLERIKEGQLQAEVGIVISDRRDAYALQRAAEQGLNTTFINPDNYDSVESFEQVLLEKLAAAEVELLVLAGFMRILSSRIIDNYQQRIINIHPSLLPSFPGLAAQRQALEHGVKISGCTAHFVDAGMDTGPIILQAAVPVKENDTTASLAERILHQEHRILPEAVNLYARGQLEVKNGRVIIKEEGQQ